VLGHTGGDLTVFVPDARVLFTGDLLWRKVPPNLIDGSVAEWIRTDTDFIAMPDSSAIRFVPGHGDVADRADVEDFRKYLLDLRTLVAQGRKAGLAGDALAAEVTAKLRTLHPDWAISDRAAAAEVRYIEQELAGTKKRPIPQPD
jgi:glyoxylase-like metal-dependent hydrolase (beta-lactamase superfamily II)